jgi:hypothetical protein
VYFNEAKLIAVDHPAGTRIHPHELAAVTADPPPFELFCYGSIVKLTRAVDSRGQDVTGALAASDRIYASPPERDSRFVGFARDHCVELDFADRLNDLARPWECEAPAEPISSHARREPRILKGACVLFLDGWVEYSTSTSNYAAAQAGLRLKAPTVSVLREGKWVELFHEVGYPAGINHVMTLDLSGKLCPGDRKIRISTNMDLSWDRIFLAHHLAEAPLRLQEVEARSADLHFLGYPREYSPDGRRPNLLDYANINTSDTWLRMAGSYTRYGDVIELVRSCDDRFAIMASGDEITLRFPASAFGPAPAGFTRTFLFKGDSFCKDMDFYTGGSEKVEPLPFHGMSVYPYGPGENYPDTDTTRRYRREYNTRIIVP